MFGSVPTPRTRLAIIGFPVVLRAVPHAPMAGPVPASNGNTMNFPAMAPPAARRQLHEGARSDDAPSAALAQGTVATSFAVFEPVGCVMLGLPGAAPLDAVVAALHHAGWPATALQRFAPHESVDALGALIDSAAPLSGFSDEVALLRRYLALSRQGCRWLLVKVSGVDHAASAAEVARRCGALLAVHYRLLTVDELL